MKHYHVGSGYNWSKHTFSEQHDTAKFNAQRKDIKLRLESGTPIDAKRLIDTVLQNKLKVPDNFTLFPQIRVEFVDKVTPTGLAESGFLTCLAPLRCDRACVRCPFVMPAPDSFA